MNKPLVVEINGTGTKNRGAELMAIAIAERLRSKYDNLQLVVPESFGSREALEKYDLMTTWELPGRFHFKFHSLAKRFIKSLPDTGTTGIERSYLKFKKKFSPNKDRMVDPSQIDIVLDASGFAFGDQWGPRFARRLVEKMNRPGRAGKPIVLLPQAFGTFEQKETANSCARLIERACLCFPRDAKSHDEVNKIVSGLDYIFPCPDFTPLVSALPVEKPEGEYVSIVPNYRMLDMGDDPEAYLAFLLHASKKLTDKSQKLVLVLHDSDEDKKVIEMLVQNGVQAESYTSQDPRELKAFLGGSKFVIGSRFHALVSTLSQAVPCIGAGWSHKYPELFSDYDCLEFHQSDLSDLDHLDSLLDKLVDPNENKRARDRIETAGNKIKETIESMWARVFEVIDQSTGRKN